MVQWLERQPQTKGPLVPFPVKGTGLGCGLFPAQLSTHGGSQLACLRAMFLSLALPPLLRAPLFNSLKLNGENSSGEELHNK